MVIKIEKELEEMEQTILMMGEKVMRMHERIQDVIQHPDKTKALEIMQSDDRINHLEEEINDLAIAALALLSPVASDLRRVVAGIKIASELERIADYAKNIAVFMIQHEQVDSAILEYANQMEVSFCNMLSIAMKAYEEKDANTAFTIPELDTELDEMNNALQEKVRFFEDIHQLRHAINAAVMLRSIERAGDHTKNICEHIIYLVKGQHYDFG